MISSKTAKNVAGISLVIFLSIFFSSCVTQKKFDRLMADKLRFQADLDDCQNARSRAEAELAKAEEELTILRKANEDLKRDTADLNMVYSRLKSTNSDLNQTYEALLRNHNALLSNSASEMNKMQIDLGIKEKRMLSLLDSLNTSRATINALSDDLRARERRVKELEKVLEDKEKAVAELRSKVMNALLNFNDKDLKVEVKNGKVYVSLSEQLLFRSGSYAVDSKGAEAIKKLAAVLKDNRDVNVLVEGHTDDVPISKGTSGMADNWDLSVLRANAIVRIMVDAGANPKMLTAAGRSQFNPVDGDKSKEARQKNRRTEIILTPNLDDLFKILE